MRWSWCLVGTILFAGCAAKNREISPIQLTSMVTLGADSGDGAITTTPDVSAWDSAGYRIVIPARGSTASLPLVFDGDGRYLNSLRRGDSAGGSTSARFARIGPGDSIWVFDNASHASVFDRSRHYVRSLQFGSGDASPAALRDAVVLPDGRIAATTDSAALQLFDVNGVMVRAIGAQEFSGSPPTHDRHLARAADGTIWTTTTQEPWRLERWDTGGRLLKAFHPMESWMVDSFATRRSGANQKDVPPAPTIRAIWLDVSGRVWVVATVADRHWHDGFAVADGKNGAHIEPDRYYDTVIEVRNPDTGQLIATARFDIACESIAEAGVVVHEVATHAGWLRADLRRVILDTTMLGKTRQ